MSTAHDRTVELPAIPSAQDGGEPPDPLAKITLTPRAFAAVLATAALLIGLALALIPVWVAAPDPASASRIGCGNTIGGAETASIAAGLGQPADQETIVSYIGICEAATAERRFYSWPMFFAGGLVIVWMGVVRTGRAVPT